MIRLRERGHPDPTLVLSSIWRGCRPVGMMQLTAVLVPAPEGGFVATNPETGTTTQGETAEEALANLREATELYLEESPMES